MVHLLVPAQPLPGLVGPRVGFVVSRAVGPAVTRNLVKRRLRSLAREWTDRLPPSAMLVVRAQPAAATASYAQLSRELDLALQRCQSKASAPMAER